MLAGAAAVALTMGMAATAPAAEPVQVAQGGSLPAGMSQAKGLPQVDNAVSPCQDFFRHACGPWINANPIPPDRASWLTMSAIAERNQQLLREILEEAGKGDRADTRRIGAFYATCMDEAAAEAKGLDPVRGTLERIAALKGKAELPALLADLHLNGVGALFQFEQSFDFKNSDMQIAAMDQGGLGLPDRDYYFKDDEKSKEQRAAYVAHVARMFELAGDTPEAAKAKADTVMAIETRLAEASWDRIKRRNPENLYNPRTFQEFSALAPSFDWAAYRGLTGAPAFDNLSVTNPDFFPALEKVLTDTSLEDLKTYLSWHTLSSAAPWLSQAFVQENWDFYSRTLQGAKEIRPRWKRCVAATDSALGEELGRFYVERAFGPAHKERMLRMVGDLEISFEEMIKALDWMGPETKTAAVKKLHAITNKIGYPEKWRDYAGLEVKPDDLLGNMARANAHNWQHDLRKIGTEVDPMEWGMTPPTVNAYYHWLNVEIVFPAGILQPPMFDMAADDAVNYGAIGSVIGHEITHGFDDNGRKFDAAGNLVNWWSEEDGKRFEARAQCLVDQYGAYVAEGDVTLNGKATLGENVADNGGVRMALNALLARLGDKAGEKIGGYTATQRFFLGYAQAWCGSMRPELRRLQALTGVHSIAEYRVNGVVSNMEAFAKAFNCKPTDPMVRGDKSCRVW